MGKYKTTKIRKLSSSAVKKENKNKDEGKGRVWVKCKHGTWLSPCPLCREEEEKK